MAIILGKILNGIVYSLNYLVLSIENLPGSLIQHIDFGSSELFITYIFIILISTFFLLRKYKYLIFSLVSILFFLCVLDYKKISTLKSSKFIVYNIPGYSFSQFHQPKTNVTILYNNDVNNKLINNYLNSANAEKIIILNEINKEKMLLIPEHNIFLKAGKKILFIENDKLNSMKNNGTQLAIDYIVLMQNANIRMDKLLEFFNFNTIIFDSSNSYFKRNFWKEQSIKLGINFHDVRENGAFIAELPHIE